MFIPKKPSTPMKGDMNILQRERFVQSPMSKYSSITPDKPLMPQSRSIRKQQIIDVNLSHIPTNRLYSPNPSSISSPPRSSLKQLAQKSNRIQILKSPLNNLGPMSRETINSRPPTSMGVQSSDPCLILGFESVQGESVKLKGLIREREKEIHDLTNKLNSAHLQIQKMGMESKANVYYCELINQIGDMLGMQSISLNDLKKRIKDLVDRDEKQGEKKPERVSSPLRVTNPVAAEMNKLTTIQRQLEASQKSRNELVVMIQEITEKYHRLQLIKKEQEVETTKIANQNYLFQKRVTQLELERDNLITQIKSSKSDNTTQALKNRLREVENKLVNQGEQNQLKLQQLMNLRVIKQQLQHQLSVKSKENLKLRSDLQQTRSQTTNKQKQLLNQIQEINQLRQVKNLEIEGMGKLAQKYEIDLGVLRRELNVKISQYQSLKKTHNEHILGLESIKIEINKELNREHGLRISAEEKLREKMVEINKHQTHIVSLEKQNLGLISEVRQLEVGSKGELTQNKELQRMVDNLEAELSRQKQVISQLKKSFEISRNEWVRQHNTKIKLQIEPLKQRTNELEILCRKYQGVIRELEENSRSPSTLKDARVMANELHLMARSEEYSQQKIHQIQKLIKQIVTNQSLSSEKMSLDLTKSIINIRQDEERRFNEMLMMKDREISECQGRIGELEAKFRAKVGETDALVLRLNQQSQSKDSTRKELELSQQEISKYSQELIRYKSKLEVLEKNPIDSNHQNLIAQYQREISNLQSQLNQLKLSQNDTSSRDLAQTLELRLKQSETKYQENIRSLETTYRTQLQNIKESHRQGLSDLEQIYSKSRGDAMAQNDSLRAEVSRLVAQRATSNQRLEERIKMLERQVEENRASEQETERFSNGQPDRTIRELKLKLQQYQLRINNSQQNSLKLILKELQAESNQLRRQLETVRASTIQEEQIKYKNLQQFSNKQVGEIVSKLQEMITKNQKLQGEIQQIRVENDVLRKKNVELNLQIVSKLSSDDVHRELLKERNQTIIALQAELNQASSRMDQLRSESVHKNKVQIESLLLSKSIEFNAEKEIIHLKNHNKVQELKISELSSQIQRIQHLTTASGIHHIQNPSNHDIPHEPGILKRPSSRNGSKPSTAEQRNPRISSLEKTIEATRTLIENNRRTSAEIKAQLPGMNTIDPYATIKPIVYHERSGSKSPRGVNMSRLVLQSESPKEMGQSPTVRSHFGEKERERPPSRGQGMFKRVKDDKNTQKAMNFNYSKFYEESGVGQSRGSLQFTGGLMKAEQEFKNN